MKITKLLALIMACLMVVCAFAACDSGDDAGTADTTPADGAADAAEVTIKVSIQVKNIDGDVVYDVPEYTYKGKAPNLIQLIDDYLYLEEDTEVGYDEYDNLQSIGSVEAGEVTSHNADTNEDVVEYTTYWWYELNGKDGSQSLEEYIVKDGDAIVYYLMKTSSRN